MQPLHMLVQVSVLILLAQPCLVAAQDVSTTALSTAQKASYAQAVQSFRARRYSDAYGRFAQLADAGHVPSAQLALVMYRNGLTLFDSNWAAEPGRQKRWNALIIDSARESPLSDDHSD